jgi:hypothetical protein
VQAQARLEGGGHGAPITQVTARTVFGQHPCQGALLVQQDGIESRRSFEPVAFHPPKVRCVRRPLTTHTTPSGYDVTECLPPLSHPSWRHACVCTCVFCLLASAMLSQASSCSLKKVMPCVDTTCIRLTSVATSPHVDVTIAPAMFGMHNAVRTVRVHMYRRLACAPSDRHLLKHPALAHL